MSTMAAADAAQNKRIRGAILEVLYARHQAQQSRVDHIALWRILRDLGCDVGENDVITQLQDLSDREYVKFAQKRNRLTNRVEITLIQLTARGRDLVEATITDAAITF